MKKLITVLFIYFLSIGLWYCKKNKSPTATSTAPDLIVTLSASRTTVELSNTITLTAILSNTGTEMSDPTILRWYRSIDSNITTADTPVETNALSNLAAGERSSHSITITVTNTPGTYYYGVCVDSVTGEPDPANNCSSALRVVVTAPDLIVTNMMASRTTVAPSEMITLTAMVRNMGDRSSTNTTLRWYRSMDNSIDINADIPLATSTVSNLGVGASITISKTITASNIPGTNYYYACVDRVTGEPDPANNCSSAVRVVVMAPDLIVSITPSSTNVSPSAMITLTATVSNTGGSSTATTLRWYRSTDTSIDTNDTSVGTIALSNLSVGGRRNVLISITVPNAPGTYYYGACVDRVTGETDPNDNCSSAVRVVVTAP